MAYTVNLKSSAERELEDLPAKVQDRIIKALIYLKERPRPVGVRKLRGKEGYRLRIGNYCILYTIDDSESKIEVFSIGHRRDVYR